MITKSYYQLMSRFKPTYRYPCLIILLALIVIESISYVNCNNTGSGGTGGIQNTTKTTFNLGSLTGLWYRVYATGKSDCLTLEIVHNVETKQYDLIERKNFQLISRLQSSIGADGIIRLKRNETGYPLSLKILSTDLANYFMIHFVDLTKNLAAVGVYTRDKPETLDDDLLDVCNRTLNKTGIKLPLRPVEYLNCQLPPLVDSSLGGTRDVDEVVLPNRPTLATLLYKTIGTWFRVYSSSGDGFISFTYVSIQGSQPPLFRILIRQSSTDYLSGHMIVDADGHKYTVIRDDNNQQLATIECLNYEINSYFIFKITDNNNKVNIYVFTPTPVQNPTVLNIAKQTLQRLGLDFPLQTNVVNGVDGSANTKTTADNTNNQIPPSSVTSDTDTIMLVPDSTMADQLRKVPSIETLTTKLTGRWFRVYGSHADNYNMFDITLIPGSQPPELEFKIHHDTKNKILTGHMILDGNGHILDFIKPSRQVIYKYLTYELPNYYIVLFKNVDTNFVGIDVYSRSDQPNQKYLLKLARSTLQNLDLNYILIESNLVQVKIKAALNQIDNNELVLPKTPTEQIILYEMIGRWYRLYGSHESDFSVNDITITPGSQPPEIVFTFRNDKTNVNVKNLLKFENNQYILVNNANGNRLQYRFLYYEPTSFYIVESISNNNKIRIDMFSRNDETNENTRKMVLKIMIKLGLNYPIQPLTGPTHWMPDLIPNNGFPKVPTVQTVMNQLTGRWYRVYGSKQREYNTYEITYISGTQPPEMQFIIHHDTDNKTETGRMIVSGNDYVVYFAISDIKPIVYKYLWYDLPNYFIILYKNTDTDAVGVDVISRYDKPKQNYLLKTAKQALESLKLDYPLIETDLVPIKIKSAMTQVDNKLVVLPNKPTAQIVLYELTGRWFRIYSTQETNTNINDITYTYGSQPPEINYILSNVDNSQVVRNMLKIENNEYILVNTATGSRLSYRFLHYEPTAFYIIYFNSSTNNNNNDNNDINAGVHVFSRNDNSDNNLLNLSTKILQQLGLNFKLLSVKDSTDLSRNLINKYNNDLPNATAIQKPILTNELPNIPSIQTLTNKMTGRWYLMYSTNMNDYNVNDITNIPGSQPNKLKWFRKSSYVNVNYKVGHVTLLNNRYVAEENGIKILFKFVDYQPNKYMIFQYLNLKTNEVGVDVFTRSDKSDLIVLKIANQALKQLNINGKLSSDPKPKNQLTDQTNDKIDLPRVPTMHTLLRQMTGRWFRVFGTQQDWHMNINDIIYIPESQPPEFRWILRSESDPRKYDQGSLLIDGNYRTYVFDRLKIKGSLNYLNYDPTKYFIGHYYRESTHEYGVDVYSRSSKSNQNDLLELANHTLKRLGLKYRLIPVKQLESDIRTTDFGLLPISLPKIPTMSQMMTEMTGVWYRVYSSRMEFYDIFNLTYIPGTEPALFNYDIRALNNKHHYVLRVKMIKTTDNVLKTISFDNNEEYNFGIINYDPANFYILKENINNNDVTVDVFSRSNKQDVHILDVAYRTLNKLNINVSLMPFYPLLPQNTTLSTTTGADNVNNQTLPNVPSAETMIDQLTGRWYEIYGTNINSDNVYDITYIPNTQPPQWEWIIRNNLNKYYVMARGKLDGNQYTLDYTASDVKYIINYLNYKSSTFFMIKSENTFDKTVGIRVFSRSYSNNLEQLEILDIAKQTMARLNLNYKIDQADSLKWNMNYVNNIMLPKLLPKVPSTPHMITRLIGPWHRIYSSQLAGPLGYSITYIPRTLPPQLKFDINNGSTSSVSTYTVQIKLVGKQYQFVRTDTDQLITVEFLNYRSKYYKIIKTIDDNNKVIIDVYSRSAKQNQTQLDIAYRTLYRLGYNVNLLTIDQQPAVSNNKVSPDPQTTGANTPEATPVAVTAEQLPRVPPLYTYITKFIGRWTRVFSSELNNDGFYGYNILSIPNTQPPQLEFNIQYLNHINVSKRYEIQLLDKTYLLVDTNTKSQTKVDFLNYDSNSYFIVKSLNPNTDSVVIDVYSRSDKPNLTVQEIAKWTLEMLGLNNITLLTVYADTPIDNTNLQTKPNNNVQPIVLPEPLTLKTPQITGSWSWMYGSDRTGFKSITSAYVNSTQPYVAIIAKENENKYISGSLRPKINGNNEFEFIMDGNNNQVFATIEILNYESGCFVMSKSIFINDPTTYIDVFGVSNKPNKTILNIAEQTLRQLGLDYTLLSIDDKYVPDISRIITNDVTPPPPEITTISDEISPALPEITTTTTTTTTTTSLSTTTEKIAELLATPSPVARDFVANSLKTDNFNWLEGKWYELYATLKNNKLCAQTVFNRTGSQSELTFTTFNDCSKLSSGLLKKLPDANSQLAMIGKDITASLWILDTGAETQKTHFLALKSFNFQDDVIENYILFSRTSKLSDPDMTKIVEQLARLVSHAKLVPTLHPDKCTCNH
ncbi:uncharacterized protein LOC128956055 isoform X2 [Oppia nitens]|uniref:uncharacterized protein LOC128956055 isoform X2 n=1 Tax=Oppia nitens TaxID=1686743 RepID=UPI0023D9DFF0|nr:uncharacterized protein LOC128956055 isoform X2 [Oppia nitens]